MIGKIKRFFRLEQTDDKRLEKYPFTPDGRVAFVEAFKGLPGESNNIQDILDKPDRRRNVCLKTRPRDGSYGSGNIDGHYCVCERINYHPLGPHQCNCGRSWPY